MTAYGFDWVWDSRAKNGMGGFVCHIHTDEAQEHTDFLTGLHDKDWGNDRCPRTNPGNRLCFFAAHAFEGERTGRGAFVHYGCG